MHLPIRFIITLYNVYSVPWGGAQYRGGVQYHGGYHEYREGISRVTWGMSSTVVGYCEASGGIMSTMGVFSTVEVLKKQKIYSPTVLNTPTVLTISPTCIMISLHVS